MPQDAGWRQAKAHVANPERTRGAVTRPRNGTARPDPALVGRLASEPFAFVTSSLSAASRPLIGAALSATPPSSTG